MYGLFDGSYGNARCDFQHFLHFSALAVACADDYFVSCFVPLIRQRPADVSCSDDRDVHICKVVIMSYVTSEIYPAESTKEGYR